MVLLKAILFDLGDKFVPERGKAKTLPYALEVLTDLNLSLSLLLFGNATTVTLERVKEIMKNAEILDFLDAIIVSTDVDHSKPDERIFQIALEKLGVETTGSNNGGQSHLNRHPRWE